MSTTAHKEYGEMPSQNAAGEMLAITYRNGVPGYQFGRLFIPRMAGGETPPTPDDDAPPKPDDQTGKDGTAFDAARAQRTIDALREEVKTGKATARELEAAKAKLKEIEDAGKSELERATAKAAEEEAKRAAAEQRAADLVIRLTVERAAGKMGFHDPDDAYRLIDRAAVEMDEDGEPKNVEKLLDALAKAKPHLVKTADGEQKPKPAERGTPPTPKPNGKVQTRDELVAEKVQKLKESGSYVRIG